MLKQAKKAMLVANIQMLQKRKNLEVDLVR